MAQYEVLRKCFLTGLTTGQRICNVGELVEYDDSIIPSNPDVMEPVGEGPHNLAHRRFDIPGYENLPLHKRAETWGAGGRSG